MGKKPRPRPKRLAEKLLQIRNALELSQSEMFWRLDIEEFTEMKRVSDFETGRSEPCCRCCCATRDWRGFRRTF